MRRKDREMDEAFAWYVVDKCSYFYVSMVLPDQSPYGVPLSLARMGEKLYFHCAKEGTKLDALAVNSRVSVACVGEVRPRKDDFTTEYESTILKGIASPVEDPAVKIEALRAICQRYTPENMAAFDDAICRSLSRTAVWEIQIETITGKRKKYDSRGKEMKFGRMEDEA